ncbi:MAG TPA: urate hydroxylase PuuD [Acidimicrobiales bacterium]|nr:urate hydroxylase PuuD [Acidimicrobiales bacterium]
MEIFEEYGIEFLARYAHIISGVAWIGLLYYFNFVQTPAFAAFEAGPRNEAFAKLVPRALWWFRWAAASTLAFGLLLFALGMGGDFAPFDDMKSIQTLSILAGMLLGIIMFLNVWLVIWPNQKIVIANAEGVLAGREADPAAAAAARKGACASRTNALFSIPMLFFMVATGHLTAFGGFDTSEGGKRAIWYVVVLAVAVVFEAIALSAPAAGKPQAWHIDQHKNTIILGFVLTAVLYLVMEMLFG